MAPLHQRCLVVMLLFLVFLVPTFSTKVSEDSSDLDFDLDELEDLDKVDEPEYLAEQEDASMEDFDGEAQGQDDGSSADVAFDEHDVVILSGQNFSDFIINNQFVMVEFYAPWCGHCQALAPEYAAAATELKEVQVPVAKVDATVESELAQKYSVDGFPTVYFFMDGVHRSYPGDRTKDGIVSWVKKRIAPPVIEVTTSSDAETIIETGNTVAVALFEKLEGPAFEEFASAARLEDGVLFYQTISEEVAEVFNIKKGTKAPAIVLLKNEVEKILLYDGKFQRDEILDFILANKHPLVTIFSRDNAASIFESHIKKQLLLFVNPDNHGKFFPIFEEAAKSFKGKIIFVVVDPTDQEFAKPVLEFFGVSPDKPKILGFLSSEEQSQKYLFKDEITVDNIKVFGEDFIADKLQPLYRSEPIPEKNDGDVKIVVGDNFDDIVLDESKDVLLEVYAPWCGYCQELEPIYNRLAKLLRSVKSLVVAKMDGTTNDHARAKADGFPTLLLFPAGNKSFEPINVDSDRTLKSIYQFVKKNVAIPFTLPKPTKSVVEEVKSASADLHEDVQPKDEL